MAHPANISNMPVLYHHVVINKRTETRFRIDNEWIKEFSAQAGGYWTCHLPDGDLLRLHICYAAREIVSGWPIIQNRFGLVEGQQVNFLYLGGERFRVEIPDWDGLIMSNVPLYYYEEENEEPIDEDDHLEEESETDEDEDFNAEEEQVEEEEDTHDDEVMLDEEDHEDNEEVQNENAEIDTNEASTSNSAPKINAKVGKN